MCTDPRTKIDEATGLEITYACRTCNECIATRRHGWEARAMAEKAVHPFTLCLALTYDASTKENRQARQMFCYADVSAFLKRLRRAAQYWAEKNKLPIVPYVRFILAGEQGERGERHCHWHMILYSNVDIRLLGEMVGVVDGRRRVVTWPDDARHIMTVGKRKRRINWSIWGRGFVTFQEPDQGGVHYVLSYCLKDQFTPEKSQGTMREAKSENFATGLFRMSKRPAIGEEFIIRKMEALDASASVLPSLQILIPDFHGFWHPNGTFREKILWHLRAINQRVRWMKGHDAPQWGNLVASCADNEKDMEILLGQKTERQQIFDEIQDDDRAKARSLVARLEAKRDAKETAIDRTCGRVLPCWRCLHKVPPHALRGLGVERVADGFGGLRIQAREGFAAIEDRQRQPGARLNFWCQGHVERAFERGEKSYLARIDVGGPFEPEEIWRAREQEHREWLARYRREKGLPPLEMPPEG